MPLVYLNGAYLDAAHAAISPFDIGLLRGYAVFDLLRTVHGRPFLLAEHLQRLRSSAEELGLRVPVDDAEISAAIERLLEANGHEEATVRLVLTGGESPDGMNFDPETPTFLIMTHELHEPPAALYEQGGRLVLKRHVREMPKAKTTNYITMLRHRDETASAGALDLLYHDGERVYEAASASVYFVTGKTILAPEKDVLWGTIGSLVLEIAESGYEVVNRDVALGEALAADEVFLTSTTRGVVPIVALGEHVIGDGDPGPVVRELMAAYRRRVFGEDAS